MPTAVMPADKSFLPAHDLLHDRSHDGLRCRQRHPEAPTRSTTSCPQKARSGAHTFAGFPSGYLREVVHRQP